MTFADDRERSPTDPYLRGPALWSRMIVWAFVIVPWWVLVVFRPVQDARMLWRVMTRPAEAGTTIAGWLVQSYGHVLPIWPWPRPQPNQTRSVPRIQAPPPSGTHRGRSRDCLAARSGADPPVRTADRMSLAMRYGALRSRALCRCVQ